MPKSSLAYLRQGTVFISAFAQQGGCPHPARFGWCQEFDALRGQRGWIKAKK